MNAPSRDAETTRLPSELTAHAVTCWVWPRSEQCLIERIKASEQRLSERIDASERRLLAELARHTRASHEEMSTQISVIDEKYADLPPRVRRLEIKAFPPRRR